MKSITSRQWRLTDLDKEQQQKLLAAKPTWHGPPSCRPPRISRSAGGIAGAEGPQAGLLFLLASHDPTFGETNNRVELRAVWVSDLALVMRTRQGEGVLEGFVLDANSGEPIAGADSAGLGTQRKTTAASSPRSREDRRERPVPFQRPGSSVHASRRTRRAAPGDQPRVLRPA